MLFVLAGFLTGIIGGLFGVGGGEIFIPLLIYGFGFTQHKAQGTSLGILLPPSGSWLRSATTKLDTWISAWQGSSLSASSLARRSGQLGRRSCTPRSCGGSSACSCS